MGRVLAGWDFPFFAGGFSSSASSCLASLLRFCPRSPVDVAVSAFFVVTEERAFATLPFPETVTAPRLFFLSPVKIIASTSKLVLYSCVSSSYLFVAEEFQIHRLQSRWLAGLEVLQRVPERPPFM